MKLYPSPSFPQSLSKSVEQQLHSLSHICGNAILHPAADKNNPVRYAGVRQTMDGHVHVVFAREVFSLMPDLYESQQYCDCTLVADDHGESESKHYRAHRIVLSSISKVLRRELESSEGANLIRLVVKPEIVEIFLGLVYSGILRYVLTVSTLEQGKGEQVQPHLGQCHGEDRVAVGSVSPWPHSAGPAWRLLTKILKFWPQT